MTYSIETLRLDGFKSFRRPTEMHFSPGVSVLVGRNGSGKSNVVDALRWVLGENDLRSLRVQHARELRSAGTGSEPPARRVDVTALLTVNSPRGTSRTVVRWLNGADTEWTLDAEPIAPGAAHRDFAGLRLQTVIRQGEVGRLLWLQPEERAQVFATALRDHVPADGTDGVSQSDTLAQLLRGRVPSSDRQLFDRVVQALERTRSDTSQGAVVPSTSSRTSRDSASFLELHARVADRFNRFFSMLVPGGTGVLPVDRDGAAGRWRVGLRVAFPGKPQVPVASLSGGQLATVGLCLALAFFLEVPSPALVLDEVEPALDEAMVRRLASLLRAVSLERQVIVVSHQRRIRDTADVVFDLRRSAAEGSHLWFRYGPRRLRAPGGGSRA